LYDYDVLLLLVYDYCWCWIQQKHETIADRSSVGGCGTDKIATKMLAYGL